MTETAHRPARKTMTKTQRIAQERLYRYAWEASHDLIDMDMIRDTVPDAWHTLEQDLDVTEKKEKVTLYLDTSVAKAYRAMGNGYQARINRLLATWVQMKIAEVLRTDRILDSVLDTGQQRLPTRRPERRT